MPRRTSSYAVLGLLTVKRWTPYELVTHIRRSTIRFIWPRAESKLYEEPKRLVARGFAERNDETSERATYGITSRGRTALADWVSEPGGGVTVESEAMLKVLFADAGTKEQLLATIAAVREETETLRDEILRGNAMEFAAGAAAFPERAHLSMLVAGFISRIQNAIIDWSEWAEVEVSRWPDVASSPERKAEAREFAAAWLAAHPSADIAAAPSASGS